MAGNVVPLPGSFSGIRGSFGCAQDDKALLWDGPPSLSKPVIPSLAEGSP